MNPKLNDRSGAPGSNGLAAASLALLLAMSVLATAAAAQDAPPAPPPIPVTFGQPTAAALDDSDPIANGRRYDGYRMTLSAGAVVQIDMASDEFDTVVEVRRLGEGDALAENDDFGEGLNSRLIFAAPGPGDYEIRAQAFSTGTGRYTLTVRPLAAAAAAAPLARGRTEGALGATDGILPSTDNSGATYRYRPYGFEGRRGQRIRIDMRASGIDSRLQLLDESGNTVIADDDSGGGPPNARIVALLPRDGRYLVRAIAPSQQVGPYTLEFAQIDAPTAVPTPQALPRAGVTPGALALESPLLMRSADQISYFYRYYTLPVRAGETLTVEMRSTEFRPYLDAGAITPVGFGTVPWVPGRGTGPGTIARIVAADRFRLILRADQTGTVILRARGTGPAVGAFTLTVTSGAAP